LRDETAVASVRWFLDLLPERSPVSTVPMFAMFGLGPMELLIVAGVVLLLFGSRLPKVMRSLGEGIVEFKRGVQGIEDTGPRDSGRTDAR